MQADGTHSKESYPRSPYSQQLDTDFSNNFCGKSAQKAFAILRVIRRTLSRITPMDFQLLYGAYVRPLLKYANQVVYSGRTKDVTLIERVQRATTRMVAGPKSVDYETRLAMLDLFPLERLLVTSFVHLRDNHSIPSRGKATFVKRLTKHQVKTICQCKRRFLQDAGMDLVGPQHAKWADLV
ncbi:hypothetical protein T265_01186 [Opisthorchis viverrini]|uniref:Uncharacterized protein n=1 Tax=Opisthorchis viverrini TaxID=6198 RepID=A0A075A3P9_OPIVI|nr:hypothetical protein T265_01186 [Opisthorchis viverrini]KER32907.1 hypothetical protein T265_01186 [Opisthorchis viverrini]